MYSKLDLFGGRIFLNKKNLLKSSIICKGLRQLMRRGEIIVMEVHLRQLNQQLQEVEWHTSLQLYHQLVNKLLHYHNHKAYHQLITKKQTATMEIKLRMQRELLNFLFLKNDYDIVKLSKILSYFLVLYLLIIIYEKAQYGSLDSLFILKK